MKTQSLPKNVLRLFAMSRTLWINGTKASNGAWFAAGVTTDMLIAGGYTRRGNVWKRCCRKD